MQYQQSDTQTEKSPLVSFVITYYNLPLQLLRECLESVLALSLRSYEREIIIIDDGSDSSPVNDLLPYGDEITYIRKKHEGLSVARNMGIMMAKGTYIQFIDSDDKLLQMEYERCLDIVRFSKPDMVLFDFTDTEEKNDRVSVTPDPVSGTEWMRHHNIRASACCYLFRKHILGELRFTDGIYHEDEEFTPQLILRAEVVYPLENKAYLYRHRRESITGTTDGERKTKRLNDMRQVIFNLHGISDTIPTQERLALQRRTAQLTMDYLYNTILLTRSRKELETRLEELEERGLFPLPDQDYTQKYKWFRRLSGTYLGRTLLIHAIPWMKRER